MWQQRADIKLCCTENWTEACSYRYKYMQNIMACLALPQDYLRLRKLQI